MAPNSEASSSARSEVAVEDGVQGPSAHVADGLSVEAADHAGADNSEFHDVVYSLEIGFCFAVLGPLCEEELVELLILSGYFWARFLDSLGSWLRS